MIFLYSCYAGEGDDNIAQQLSLLLNDHETFVIGPIGVLESFAALRSPQDGKYDGVKNTKGKEGAFWGVYKNGKLEATIRGNRVCLGTKKVDS